MLFSGWSFANLKKCVAVIGTDGTKYKIVVFIHQGIKIFYNKLNGCARASVVGNGATIIIFQNLLKLLCPTVAIWITRETFYNRLAVLLKPRATNAVGNRVAQEFYFCIRFFASISLITLPPRLKYITILAWVQHLLLTLFAT